jgi:hypothetical protein
MVATTPRQSPPHRRHGAVVTIHSHRHAHPVCTPSLPAIPRPRPRNTCAPHPPPPSPRSAHVHAPFPLALVLTLPARSQRQHGGDAAMTIATVPSSWRRRYHPLSPSRSLRAHPVLALPPRDLTTHMHAARRHPPHGAPAQPNECPHARPSSRSQRRHGDNDAVTIAAVRSPWRRRHHPPSPSRPLHPGPGLTPPRPLWSTRACLPRLPSPVCSSPPGLTGAHPVLPCPHAHNTDMVTTTPRRSHRTIAVVIITTHPHRHAHFTHIPPRPSSHPALALTPPAHNTDVVAVTHPHSHVHLLAPTPRPLWSTRNAALTRARNTPALAPY